MESGDALNFAELMSEIQNKVHTTSGKMIFSDLIIKLIN